MPPRAGSEPPSSGVGLAADGYRDVLGGMCSHCASREVHKQRSEVIPTFWPSLVTTAPHRCCCCPPVGRRNPSILGLTVTHHPISGTPAGTWLKSRYLVGFPCLRARLQRRPGEPRQSHASPSWQGKTLGWEPVATGLAPALTSANDPSVLVVAAVVLPPAQVEAVGQASLAAAAAHVIQQDGPAAVAEGAEDGGGEGGATAQLPAHHLGIGEVPVVVADGAPGAAVPHLHPPTAAPVPVRQPHAATCVGGPGTSTLLGGLELHGGSNSPRWPSGGMG